MNIWLWFNPPRYKSKAIELEAARIKAKRARNRRQNKWRAERQAEIRCAERAAEKAALERWQWWQNVAFAVGVVVEESRKQQVEAQRRAHLLDLSASAFRDERLGDGYLLQLLPGRRFLIRDVKMDGGRVWRVGSDIAHGLEDRGDGLILGRVPN